MLDMALITNLLRYLTKINEIVEFNIGHFIIGESIFYGLPFVIKKFKRIISKIRMKILGIGVDIVENKRLKKSIKNKKFISRLFTLLEIKNSNHR